MSAIRDLGYKPYEGERLPSSHNFWVMYRHGMGRAWQSWLVKLAIILGVLPALLHAFVAGGYVYLLNQNQQATEFDFFSKSMTLMLSYQLWIFVSAITLGSGASTIAEDATYKVFPFYFAKPITPLHYLIGRTGAVATYCFISFFIASFLLTLAHTLVSPIDMKIRIAGLFLPALLYALIASVSLSTCAVAISALGRNRALTMSAWIALFIVPHVFGWIIDRTLDVPWLKLFALPSLLDAIETALFHQSSSDGIEWQQAALVLTGITIGSATFVLHRLSRAEVIT